LREIGASPVNLCCTYRHPEKMNMLKYILTGQLTTRVNVPKYKNQYHQVEFELLGEGAFVRQNFVHVYKILFENMLIHVCWEKQSTFTYKF
jgi:hypothetical protein